MPSNVVLPVEVAEQLRDFLGQLTRAEYYSFVTDEFANQQAEPFSLALDAALAAPEPFERLGDGDIVVKNGPMSDGGTMTRVAAIQKRLEAAAPDGNLFVDNLPAPLHPALSMFLFHVAADIAYLLRLVELAAAMQEPVYPTTNAYRCLACRAPSAYLPLTHAPDCPYAVFRAALEEVSG